MKENDVDMRVIGLRRFGVLLLLNAKHGYLKNAARKEMV